VKNIKLAVIQSPRRLNEGEQESSGLYSGLTLDGAPGNGTLFDDKLSQKSSFKYMPSTEKSMLTNFENVESARRFKKRGVGVNFLPVVIETRKKQQFLEQDSIFVPTP
jgi:hypothetical protein